MRPSPRQSCLRAACPGAPSTPAFPVQGIPSIPATPATSAAGPVPAELPSLPEGRVRSPAAVQPRVQSQCPCKPAGVGISPGSWSPRNRRLPRQDVFPGKDASPELQRVLARLPTPCAVPGSAREVPRAPRGLSSCIARSHAAPVPEPRPPQSSGSHRSPSLSRWGQSRCAPSTSHGEGPPSTRPHCTGRVRCFCVHRYPRAHRLQTCALVGSTHGNAPHKQAPI